jgi:hypothetical protein
MWGGEWRCADGKCEKERKGEKGEKGEQRDDE